MRQALRPYVTAGIALVGAGVIAVTPISAPPPDIQVRTVELSAAVQTLDPQAAAVNAADAVAYAIPPGLTPSQAYQYLFQLTLAYTFDAIAPIVSNPTPILGQVVTNSLGYANILAMGSVTAMANLVDVLSMAPQSLQAAVDQLMAGDIEAAMMTVWNNVVVASVIAVGYPFLAAASIPGAIAQNIANVAVALPNIAIGVGFGALATANSTVGATAAAVQSIVDAVGAGDPKAVVDALLIAPATVAGGFLIGGYPEGNLGLINGIVKSLVLARETIAEALGAPPREIPEGSLDPTAAEHDAADQETGSVTTEVVSSGGDTAPAPPSGDAAAVTDGSTETPEPEADPALTERPTRSVPLVRDSAKAEPGKIGLTGKPVRDAAKLVKSFSDRVSATADKLGDNIKKALTKPGKKPSGPTDGDARADSGSGSTESTGSGESG
ncbi:hypothetical protein M1247_05385 [Mycobacterium sp. 21AC1]|uniref:hypothetical protein n=1 Tax=[Mycobacterium] appelbergii TaxID=2939269 RepID=UPI002938E4FB|nr:hypothetical protein [Mycobacterium sp. 21AC1]MDV3124335.1 hypothetical protein [Mycobacterium sp. 21AC1]